MKALSPSELVKMVVTDRNLFRALPQSVSVSVARLEADAYGDLADMALVLSGRKGLWSDGRGATRPSRGGVAAAAGLARDALALPWLYGRHRWRASELARNWRAQIPADLSKGCLYLRMDHNFDLISGGSVAHTAGVINAFRMLLPSLTVISTDQLPLVAPDSAFHELTPRYGAGRNVPLFPALTYTDQTVQWWQSEPRQKPGFIYARYSAGNYAGPLLKSQLGVPYVCEYNGSAMWIARQWGGKPLRFERVLRDVENANLLSADLIVAVAEASKAELVERGYPEDRILVNPNGVDTDVYRPDIDGALVRRQFGISPDEMVVGFVGTFGRWHGAEVLAKAFAELLAGRPHLRTRVRLLLVGDGMTMPHTRAVLEQGTCADRVVFAGTVPQSDGPDYLAACDILVSPHVMNADSSRFFGSPTKLFEYMAMGRTIVASDLEQIGEVLKHGVTALLVPSGNSLALASALADCIEEPNKCRSLGDAARAEAVARYTWAAHSRRILDRLAVYAAM